MSHLRETQEAMRAALHDDEPERLLPMLEAGRLAPEDRVHVYRTMYWARQAEALADDFPVVRRMLGEALFDRVAVTHLKRRPSSSPSLAFLGRELDETLLHLGLEREAAVSRLEWARVEAFWSVDAERATAALLGSLGERFGETALVFHPSLRLVRLPPFVRRVVAGEAAGSTMGSTTEEAREAWAVWRRGNVVEERLVEASEARALEGALAGDRMADVCAVFLEGDAPEEAAITAVVRWVNDGWVCRVGPETPPRPLHRPPAP